MMISCLCVTENRPQFTNWLLWNFFNQGVNVCNELVIIDSSDKAVHIVHENIRHIIVPPSTSIPKKRNIAMWQASNGTCGWMDDDDWHSPGRFNTVAQIWKRGMVYGVADSFFLDIKTLRVCRYYGLNSPVFSSIIFDKSIAPLFDENKRKGSDRKWVDTIMFRGKTTIAPPDTVWFISHNNNISNPRTMRNFNQYVYISEDTRWRLLKMQEELGFL